MNKKPLTFIVSDLGALDKIFPALFEQHIQREKQRKVLARKYNRRSWRPKPKAPQE